MSLFGKFFRRTKVEQPSSGEKPISVTMHQPIQNGRRYLEDSTYQLPKDEQEDSRLNFQHYALFHAIGNHYVAPISPPLRTILDVGTGTGIWAHEMAKLFPKATVVGLDLATSSFRKLTPDNCFLGVGNVLTGLPFPDAFFSFTHQRLLVTALTAEDWPRAIHELVRVTNRNGWVELVEADVHIHSAGPVTTKMFEMVGEVNKGFGFHREIISHLGDLMRQEQLQGVEMQPIRIPLGEWGGRVGGMMQHDLLSVLTAMKGRYGPLIGVTGEEFDRMILAITQEWDVYRSSFTFYAVYGKRSTI